MSSADTCTGPSRRGQISRYVLCPSKGETLTPLRTADTVGVSKSHTDIAVALIFVMVVDFSFALERDKNDIIGLCLLPYRRASCGVEDSA